MTDVFSRKKRSEVMSRIRGTGNRNTELRLTGMFRRHGLTGWRRRQRLFGKPDFVFRANRLVVFVDGCFWHSCPRHCKMPATNQVFWRRKLETNRTRDRLVTKTLRTSGWKVLRIWEHELQRRNERWLLGRIARAMGMTLSEIAGDTKCR